MNLTEIEEALNSHTDYIEKIKSISINIQALIGVEVCTIFIHDPRTHSFWSAHIEGVSFIEIPDNKGIVSEVFHANDTLIINDVQNNKHFLNQIDSSTGFVTKTMLATPIIDKHKQAIGVVQLINKNKDEHLFTAEDSQNLSVFMHHISQFSERFY